MKPENTDTHEKEHTWTKAIVKVFTAKKLILVKSALAIIIALYYKVILLLCKSNDLIPGMTSLTQNCQPK